MKRLEVVPVQDRLVLLVVVLEGGVVRQQLLQLPLEARTVDLRARSAALDAELAGKDAAETRSGAGSRVGWERALIESVARMLEEQDRATARDVYYDGYLNLLQQPEFAHAAALRDMLGVLEDRTRLADVLPGTLEPGGVRVVIGDENDLPLLRHFSLVFGRYGSQRGASGFIGVVGPTRMNYARSIGAVRYVGGLMTELMSAVGS